MTVVITFVLLRVINSRRSFSDISFNPLSKLRGEIPSAIN